jgi:hypothetical protein
MSSHLARGLVTCERAMEICEPYSTPRASRPFFIPVAHSLLRAVGHVTAPKLSTGEAESGVLSHVVAPEPSLAGRQGPELRGTWQHRSPSLLGGGVRGRGVHGSSGAHLF